MEWGGCGRRRNVFLGLGFWWVGKVVVRSNGLAEPFDKLRAGRKRYGDWRWTDLATWNCTKVRGGWHSRNRGNCVYSSRSKFPVRVAVWSCAASIQQLQLLTSVCRYIDARNCAEVLE